MSKKLSVLLIISIVITVSLFITNAPISGSVVIKEYEKTQLLKETNFNKGSGLPWHICETNPAKASFELKDGKYYVTIDKVASTNANRWDIQFRHRELAIQSGHTYTVSFKVNASNSCQIYPKIGDQNDPYYEDWNINNRSWGKLSLNAGETKTVTETFTATRTAKVLEFAFHLADAPVGTVFWFDDMSITDPQFPGYDAEIRPDYREIRLNQTGYFPNRKKLATLNADETSPVNWSLQDSSGNEVYSGKTKVFGFDKDSGENVHIIDFTAFNIPGKNYKLIADSSPVNQGGDSIADSYPFDIGTNMYDNLIYDSLRYFYHSRSGIKIEMPYCKDSKYARAAGHTSDIARTLTNETEDWNYDQEYNVDMTGGWYDAGDHGKYVVNGGITVWTLQNMYERGLYNANGTSAFADNKLTIPESGNGYPDILDETRWHMEVMLKLQVPDGKSRAGMAFHKGHDITWTGLGVAPADDPKERVLKPPTTAATLNLAATGAQSYRLWKKYDSAFANKCLAAAEKAWAAALVYPTIYAPFDDSIGGGPYGDDYVKDDFYWAACELYAATNKSTYLEHIQASPHYLEVPNHLEHGEEQNTTGQFNWGNTAALGTLTLALVPSDLPASEVEKAKSNISSAADYTLNVQANQGYGITINQCKVLDTGVTGYPWGSNSFVTNSCIVLGYAYDYTKNTKYLDGMTEAMDYIMGRNPNERSYITGYGDYAVKYPHHRFFANQIDSKFPLAPDGICVGGPNSGLQDPWVKGSGWKVGEMSPQKCYMDHIESWSTNECTINWNAPIAWVSSYLAANGNDGNIPPTDTPTITPTTTVTTKTTTPTDTPTETPTDTPTKTPTDTPTKTPTDTPTKTPTDTPTVTPTITPTVTPTTFPAIKIDYVIVNDWGNGATIAITINNRSTKDINGWTLSFSFSGNQKISNSWCSRYSQSGTSVTLTNENWNALIPVNGSLSLGFNMNYSGTNSKPINFILK